MKRIVTEKGEIDQGEAKTNIYRRFRVERRGIGIDIDLELKRIRLEEEKENDQAAPRILTEFESLKVIKSLFVGHEKRRERRRKKKKEQLLSSVKHRIEGVSFGFNFH